MIAFAGQFELHPRNQFARWLRFHHRNLPRKTKTRAAFNTECHIYSAMRMNIPWAKIPDYMRYLKAIRNNPKPRPFFQ